MSHMLLSLTIDVVTKHASTTVTTVHLTMTFMKFLTLMSLMHDQ